MNHPYLSEGWPGVILKDFIQKSCLKGNSIPTERVCEEMESWDPNPSQVQVRDAYQWMRRGVNGLKNPTRNWNSLQGKKSKNQLWNLSKKKAMMASHKVPSCRDFPVPSFLFPPPSWTSVWSEIVQVSIEEKEKDKLGT